MDGGGNTGDPPDGNGNGDGMTPDMLNRHVNDIASAPNPRQKQHPNHADSLSQLRRVFPDFKTPFYVRMRGWSSDDVLSSIAGSVAQLSVPLGREFTDEEARAFGEHTMGGINSYMGLRWGVTALAGIWTWRTSKKFKFPNFEVFRAQPFARHARFTIHTARFFFAYSMGLLFALPVFQLANGALITAKISRDPRLEDFSNMANRLAHAQAQTQSWLTVASSEEDPRLLQWPSQQQTSDGASPEEQQQQQQQASYNTRSGIASQAQTGWRRPSPPSYSPTSSPSASEPASSDPWGSSLPAELDDASPIAPSMRGDAQNDGRSAWDRIRERHRSQSEAPFPFSQQQQQQQQRPGDSYSFDQAEQDRALAKSQAQEEFDRMLERERRGGSD